MTSVFEIELNLIKTSSKLAASIQDKANLDSNECNRQNTFRPPKKCQLGKCVSSASASRPL